MSKIMSDHQDSDLFAYSRSWEEIESMLNKAERQKNRWHIQYIQIKESGTRKEVMVAARNYKALEGVVKTLRWVLGDMKVENPLV